MQVEQLQYLLVEHFDAEVTKQTDTISGDRECVLLIEHDSGIMQVPRVLSVTCSDEILHVRCEDHVYFLPQGKLFGLRGALPEQAAQLAGFRRL